MNKPYKTFSEYFSDDNKRKAVIYRELPEGNFVVSASYDTGTSFCAHFKDVDDAEDFAEEWVLKTYNKNE
jgi:hypothetical protein